MITSLPNLLTLSRILVIPAFVAAFYVEGAASNWITLALFLGAAATDFLDGYIARKRDLQSHLGRFLDPVADKLLVAAAVLMLVAMDRITGASVLAGLVILCREILVSALREFLAEVRVGVPVSRLAKWKTSLQMAAIAFLLAGDAAPEAIAAPVIGEYALWIAALLTLYTGYDYLRGGLRYLSDTKSAARPQASAQDTKGSDADLRIGGLER